jgi:ligand-binding sensor domain-containing protein
MGPSISREHIVRTPGGPTFGVHQGFIAVLLLLSSLQPLAAQQKLLPVFDFRRLSTSEGLPNNEIRSNIIRDRQSLIWFGTVNGLVRYDGCTCKVYRTFRGPHDAIVLYLDTKWRLWIGTYGSGLSLYDPMKDRFVDFLQRQNDTSWLHVGHINCICEDKSGIIWLGGSPHLVRLDLNVAKDEANADSVAVYVRFHNIVYAGFGDGISKVDA